MAFGSFVLTDFGLSLEAKMKAGKQVSIKRIALGDGSIGTSSIFSVTRLKSERFSLPVSSVSYSSDEATVTAILSNEMLDEGFNLREMGLMATDPDTKAEGVYLYNRDSGEGEYLPDKNSSQRLKEYLKIRIKSSSVSNIIFETVGSPVDLTQEDMDEHNSSPTAHSGIFVLTNDKGAPGGVATLDAAGQVPIEQLPTMNYDEAGAAAKVQENLNTHATNTTPHITAAERTGWNAKETPAGAQAKADAARDAANAASVPLTQKGASGGVAELDSGGKVPAAQLPSYVDDVLEYANKSAFPAVGESGKIYVAQDTNLTWRWSGSAYVEISPSLALGETSGTAYRGDRGKLAYDHSQATGNPHGLTLPQLGAAAESHTHSPNDLTSPVPITKGGTGANTAAAARAALAALTAFAPTAVAIPLSWTGTAAPYTQTVTVAGVLAAWDWRLGLYPARITDNDARKLNDKAMACITECETVAGGILLTCREKVPTVAIQAVLVGEV